MRRIPFAAFIPVLLLLAATSATAHAVLDHAEPRVGNTVAAPPREVTLTFNQKLESAFSTIAVTDAAGQRVDTGKTGVSGNQMTVTLRPIGAGSYKVKWRVLSADSHTTDGDFNFKVAK